MNRDSQDFSLDFDSTLFFSANIFHSNSNLNCLKFIVFHNLVINFARAIRTLILRDIFSRESFDLSKIMFLFL